MNEASSVSWSSLLSFLCQKGNIKHDKCPLRVLDTIFDDSTDGQLSLSWYFTTKTGFLSKKRKGESSSNANIIDRFSTFALSNPNNSSRIISVIYGKDGERIFWGADEFIASINSSQLQRSLNYDRFLQVFLQPCKGDDAKFIASVHSCSPSDTNHHRGYSFTITKQTFNNIGMGNISSVISSIVSDEIKTCLDSIIHYLAESKNLITESLVAEFVIDDNEIVWLSNMSSLMVRIDNDESIVSLSPTNPSLPSMLNHRILPHGQTVVDAMSRSTDNNIGSPVNNYDRNNHSRSLGSIPKFKNDGSETLPTIDNNTSSDTDTFASSSSNPKRPKSDYDLTRR